MANPSLEQELWEAPLGLDGSRDVLAECRRLWFGARCADALTVVVAVTFLSDEAVPPCSHQGAHSSPRSPPRPGARGLLTVNLNLGCGLCPLWTRRLSWLVASVLENQPHTSYPVWTEQPVLLPTFLLGERVPK